MAMRLLGLRIFYFLDGKVVRSSHFPERSFAGLAVHVEVVLFEVFSAIGLAVREAEETLLQNRVLTVP